MAATHPRARSRQGFVNGRGWRGILVMLAVLGMITAIGASPVSAKKLRKPTTKSQCLKKGYRAFGFKNQGACVSYVNAHTKKKATTTTAKAKAKVAASN